jgi:hypothetical protein
MYRAGGTRKAQYVVVLIVTATQITREPNHYSHTTGDCENSGSPTVWLGHDVSAYFQTEGEKRVLLALIQGEDLGGGTVRIRIRFDPSQVLVADT